MDCARCRSVTFNTAQKTQQHSARAGINRICSPFDAYFYSESNNNSRGRRSRVGESNKSCWFVRYSFFFLTYFCRHFFRGRFDRMQSHHYASANHCMWKIYSIFHCRGHIDFFRVRSSTQFFCHSLCCARSQFQVEIHKMWQMVCRHSRHYRRPTGMKKIAHRYVIAERVSSKNTRNNSAAHSVVIRSEVSSVSAGCDVILWLCLRLCRCLSEWTLASIHRKLIWSSCAHDAHKPIGNYKLENWIADILINVEMAILSFIVRNEWAQRLEQSRLPSLT